MAAEPVYEPIEVSGWVADVTDGVARVLIGPTEEEWYYPLTMLPGAAEAGLEVRFAYEDHRYVPIQVVGDRLRTIDRRLSRPISARRTAQVDARELRSRLED